MEGRSREDEMKRPEACETMAGHPGRDRPGGPGARGAVRGADGLYRPRGGHQGTAQMPARITPRVEEVVANVRREAALHGLPPDLIEKLWRRLIDWSIAREEGVLGPEWTTPRRRPLGRGTTVTVQGRVEGTMAKVIDGKAFARRHPGQGGRACRAPQGRARDHARLGRGAGGRGSRRRRSMCRPSTSSASRRG
jgi:isochorismate pyruvate lyase